MESKEENLKEDIILFDGVCNLCNRLVIFIIHRDYSARFRFATLQSIRGQQLIMDGKYTASDFNSVIYIKGEKYYFKSSAILHILFDLGGMWKILYAFIILPSFIRDYVYELIAKSRYRIFGKRSTCMVPTEEILDRFLQ